MRDGSPAFQARSAIPSSPDGKLVAFTGQYGGNVDVYVVPIEGGEPRRLTWHPGPTSLGAGRPTENESSLSRAVPAPRNYNVKLWTVSG